MKCNNKDYLQHMFLIDRYVIWSNLSIDILQNCGSYTSFSQKKQGEVIQKKDKGFNSQDPGGSKKKQGGVWKNKGKEYTKNIPYPLTWTNYHYIILFLSIILVKQSGRNLGKNCHQILKIEGYQKPGPFEINHYPSLSMLQWNKNFHPTGHLRRQMPFFTGKKDVDCGAEESKEHRGRVGPCVFLTHRGFGKYPPVI